MSDTAPGSRDHLGLHTYGEAFAFLATGFWGKVAEPNIFGPDGRLLIEREVWTREEPDGRWWAEVLSSPFKGQSDRRWHILTSHYDPRALDSDENWERLGPKSTG